MPESRAGFGVCLVDNFIYVTGGNSTLSEVDRNQEFPTPLKTCTRYSILENKWESIASLP